MTEPNTYDFDDELRMSKGYVENANLQAVLLNEIPGAVRVTAANGQDDRLGIDYWVEINKNNRFAVDCKVRKKDCINYGDDDLALETWSVKGQKIGWTRDTQKKTDYVLWLWKDTGRWVLVPFRMLCAVMIDNWEMWIRQYKTEPQKTTKGCQSWQSECVFVPRKVVWERIYNRFGGRPRYLT